MWNAQYGNDRSCLWNHISDISGIQLKESGIPLTIRIHNPSSTDKHWNTVAGIQNPRLSKIPLRGVRLTKGWKIPSFFPSIYYKSSVDLVCYSP